MFAKLGEKVWHTLELRHGGLCRPLLFPGEFSGHRACSIGGVQARSEQASEGRSETARESVAVSPGRNMQPPRLPPPHPCLRQPFHNATNGEWPRGNFGLQRFRSSALKLRGICLTQHPPIRLERAFSIVYRQDLDIVLQHQTPTSVCYLAASLLYRLAVIPRSGLPSSVRRQHLGLSSSLKAAILWDASSRIMSV